MNRYLTLVVFVLFRVVTVSGQCTTNYSFEGTTDTLSFTNLSSVSNAHYYWNFGDGSGSNDFSPVHVFPDDGKYLVTLYGVDTVTNCVDVKESWIDVTKPDTLPCTIFFTDTMIGNSPRTENLSTNCEDYRLNCHVFATAQNICNGFAGNFSKPALFQHGMQATTNDSIYGYRIYHAYYKTFPVNYHPSSLNYQNCSANFEYVIDYQPDHARVTFTAMNKNATDYTFYISGFGNPIPLTEQSASFDFNYYSYRKVHPVNVTLITIDDVNNCSDTVIQTILIRNPNYVWPVNCAIYTPIESRAVYTGSNAQFHVSAYSEANYQWQQDAGLGFVSLSNAGPFSGVTTNTLTISNVQSTMNNNQYRCIVYDSLGGCHNTSAPASLTVDISDFELLNIKVYPNPASDILTVDLPSGITDADLTIYSMLGQQQIRTTTNSPNAIVNLGKLAVGMYVLEVKSNFKVVRQTFVKQK